jgi:acyl dehydratase
MKYKVGDIFSKDFAITSNLIKEFCLITGDNNPLHSEDDYAKRMSFEKRIAPGLLIGSLIASVIGNDFPGSGTIYLSQTLKFTRPTYVDDTVSIKIEITDIKRNNWIVLKTHCVNQNMKTVLVGEAVVTINEDKE